MKETNNTTSTLATRPAAGNGGIQRAQAAANSRFQGAEEEDTIFPRIHIFQGLPAEREIYGKHDEGDLINTLSLEVLATKAQLASKRFVPVFMWSEYLKFREPRGSGLEYRTRNKNEVPPEDLAWDRAAGTPPAVTRTINWVCIFEGETTPVVLSFKSTSLKAGQTIYTLEDQRNERGDKPGLYALDLKPKKNSKGAWLSPQIRPAGNPPADLAALVEKAMARYSPDNVSTNIEGDEIDAAGDGDGSDFDPNARG